ncbi:ATP-dependent RNA helicase DDX50 isoform X2 [Monodelphis domestica]|uniref:ATP-dependent RNA helicase DDX50 isoform X2 n=1 Tax=Monodelphis domestica TaxID=13616 RepID=UPI0000F2E9EA|nr:ATP-dependent RNA helicase DDX50 isoform X2 [Monodelphis domestica]
MPSKVLWGDLMEEEAPLDGPESPRRESGRHKSDKRKLNHRDDFKKKLETSNNEDLDELSPPKSKKSKKKEKLNGDTKEGLDRFSSEFSGSPRPEKGKRKDLSTAEENGKTSKSRSSLSNSSNSKTTKYSKLEEDLTPEQKEGAFSRFPISEETIKLLKARGVTYLFPIQVKAFSPVYEGKDLIAQARTGTGKTFSFAIPLIEKLQRDQEELKKTRSPKVLVLAPTRELANQVAKDFQDITRKLSVACFYGGTPYQGQINHIRRGIDILVGTPGRIKDHLQSGRLDLSKLRHVVLDEVDQMLDMGFADQVEDIIHGSYKTGSEDNPQTLLFSATCPQWVYKVAKKYMKTKYEEIDLVGKMTQKTATTVEHLAIQCHWSQRAAVIGDVIQVYSGNDGRAIIFCETKKNVAEMALNPHIKQNAQCLHGDIAQSQREITLKGFREGSFKVLVATNVAARGLDIPEVDLVIQSSPPQDVESYIHRSGRTGRAGRTGICICFYQPNERGQLKYVEGKAGITFKRVGVPTTMDLVKSRSMDAIRSLASVSFVAVEFFRPSAQRLIEEKGAVDALAAALAHISGASSFEPRSLINSDKGFVTMTLQSPEELQDISTARKELSRKLSSDTMSRIVRMCLLKGKMGVCFDIPTSESELMQAEWNDSDWILSVPDALPELEEYYDGRRSSNTRQRGGRSGGRFGGGRSGGRSGGRQGGRSGGRQGGGRSRSRQDNRRRGGGNRSRSRGKKRSSDS